MCPDAVIYGSDVFVASADDLLGADLSVEIH
jgi:hypothetical protein